MKKGLLLSIVLAAMVFQAFADEARGFWVPIWSMNSESKIQDVVTDAHDYNFNQIYAHIRVRGDAYYYPNRQDSTYSNPEPRSQSYSVSPSDLDALQTLIDYAHAQSPAIEVHAWVVTYNVWSSSTAPASGSHVYNDHLSWITEDSSGTTMDPSVDEEGAYLDPGVPGVNEYLKNLSLDIVRNYDVDGLHFDYIRYRAPGFGYDPLAKADFLAQTGLNISSDSKADAAYKHWRSQQINQFVDETYSLAVAEKPWLAVSSANIAYEDPRIGKYQSCDYWTDHEKMDVLIPMAYATTVSSFSTKFSRLYNMRNNRQIYAGVQAYDSSAANVIDQISEVRTNYPDADGFVFFAYSSLAANSDEIFKALTDPGGPFETYESVPAMSWKPSDTVAPNPPASVSVNQDANGYVVVSWDRPAVAADSDRPVSYRVYKSASSPVSEIWENLEMVFWDEDFSRATFSWTDAENLSGTMYYKVVAYDDNNLQASTTVSGAPSVASYIIETGTGGLNESQSATAGSWVESSSHSAAPGCTSGIGSDFSYLNPPTVGDTLTFNPDLPSAGNYEVFVTSFDVASANAPNTKITIVDATGSQTIYRDITQANCGDAWYSLGTYNFADNGSDSIAFDESTCTLSGSAYRLNPAALRFVPAYSSAAWEMKSVPTLNDDTITAGTEIIVDDDDYYAMYRDGSGWDSSSFGSGFYGSGKRYANIDSGLASYPVWCIDIPDTGQSGYYALAANVNNSTYASNVTYQFVDGSDSVITKVRSQSGVASSFGIDLDGVADDPITGNYLFDPGQKVYLSITDASGASLVVADGVKFTFLGAGIFDWTLY